MSNIVDITSLQPHNLREVICVNCKHRWLSKLECPECKQTGQDLDE